MLQFVTGCCQLQAFNHRMGCFLSKMLFAVRADCTVVHPEAICSPCDVILTVVFIRTLLFLSFCYAPKRPSPLCLYPTKNPLLMIKYELSTYCRWCFLS